MTQVRVRRLTLPSDPRCPLCREGLDGPADELAVCGGCDAVLHRECVEEFGGGACATLGCGRPLTARHVVVPRAEEVSAGGRTLLLIPPDAGCLRGGATILGMALGCFALLCVFVYGVTERRWPLWSFVVVTLAPLVAYGLHALVRELRERSAGRRRRRPSRRTKDK